MDGVVSPLGLHELPVLELELNTELPQLFTTVIVGVVGLASTIIALLDDLPSPQVPVPFTFIIPEEEDAKSIVTEFPVPFMVAPEPSKDQT